MNFAEKLEDIQQQLQGFDVNDLSVDNIGTWPLPVKIISWLLVFALIIGGGIHFIITGKQQELETAVAKEASLKKDFERKAYQAANLEAYRQQMEEMESSFGALLSQLPSDTEVPGLLEDITNKGVGSGLAFKQIQLQSEKTHEFYVELPISIQVVGTYHDMGAFVSGVASLPRIVTLKDFSIKPQGGRRDNSKLEMQITASTYRYREMGK